MVGIKFNFIKTNSLHSIIIILDKRNFLYYKIPL